jgi:hypothetical protein
MASHHQHPINVDTYFRLQPYTGQSTHAFTHSTKNSDSLLDTDTIELGMARIRN